jgi:hypothetical protein
MILLRKCLPWFGLAALIVLTFTLRCWNWEQIFVGNEIHFVDADCYSRMTRVQEVAVTPWRPIRFHDFENAPQGVIPHTTAPMDLSIVALARLFGFCFSPSAFSPSALDLAGAFISPLLGVLLMGFLWWWSRALPWRNALLLVGAISPILVHGFLLGRPDHQSLILLLVGVAFAAELSLWTRPSARGWSFLSAVCWALALWTSLFEPLILLVAVLGCRFFVLGREALRIRHRSAATVFVLLLLGAFLFDGWRAPPSDPEIREFFSHWGQTLGELSPLRVVQLFPWTGWLLPVVPILLVMRFFKDKEKHRSALALAGLVLLTAGLSLWYARWGYFLALTFAFSLPHALASVPSRPVVAIIFLISLWPVAAEWDRQFFPTDARRAALKENREDATLLRQAAQSLHDLEIPPGSTVLAPWWLSPALSYWSGRPCVAGSSHQSLPGIVASARFYMASDPAAARKILQDRDVRYVVAYEPSRVIANSAQILNLRPPEHPFGKILYDSPGSLPDWLQLRFENPYFKVYEVRK